MTDETGPAPADSTPQTDQPAPKWRPIGSIDRRILGVLAEKAKTTPEAYPLSLNAICTGCKQKSNRAPVMNLEPDDLEEPLQRLREMGAIGMIEGYGRVVKYRHYLYDWLAVDKVELAVMAELLLRGAQTEGSLRGRAARMEPIRDLSALRPVLDALKSRGLVVSLTPGGRGHVVAHALYLPKEFDRVRAEFAGGVPAGPSPVSQAAAPAAAPPVMAAEQVPSAPAPMDQEVVEALRGEIGELRSQVSQLRDDLSDLGTQQERTDDELRSLRDALGG